MQTNKRPLYWSNNKFANTRQEVYSFKSINVLDKKGVYLAVNIYCLWSTRDSL